MGYAGIGPHINHSRESGRFAPYDPNCIRKTSQKLNGLACLLRNKHGKSNNKLIQVN